MEAAGMVVGVAGLAGLFSTCLEGFSLIQSIRSHGRDYEILQTKLDVEKTRILQWGDAVGILSSDPRYRSQILDLSQIQPTIEKVLHCITMILTNADELRSKYGIRDDNQENDSNDPQTAIATLSTPRLHIFRTTYARFQSGITSQQKATSRLTKAKWAIRDREGFNNLIKDLQDFVDSLYNIVPVHPQFKRLLVKEDFDRLVPVDLGTLRLVEEACASRDDEWSDTASAQLQDTKDATESVREFINEWRQGIENGSWSEQNATLGGYILQRVGKRGAFQSLAYLAETLHRDPWVQGTFSSSNYAIKLSLDLQSSRTNYNLPRNIVEINHTLEQWQLPPVSIEELHYFQQMVRTGRELDMTEWLVSQAMASSDSAAINVKFNSNAPLIDGIQSQIMVDVCFGARSEQLNYPILEALRPYIMPSRRYPSLIAPNCFLEVKRKHSDMATIQAYSSGLAGARGLLSLQLYSQPEPLIDENAYTLTMTFCEGTLQIHAIWPINSPLGSPDEIRFEFRRALVGEWAMSASLETYQQGRAALWNAPKLAKSWRTMVIDAANATI